MSNTVLFTTTKLDGVDRLGNSRFDRTRRWFDYYKKLTYELGFDRIFFSDNASPPKLWNQLVSNDEIFQGVYRFISIDRFEEELFPLPDGKQPYCWRGFYALQRLIADPEVSKIICCDTDTFILRSEFAHIIRATNRGFYTFWSQRYQFPTAELSVICADQFGALDAWFREKTWQERMEEGKLLEQVIPFTYVSTGFVGDRYGEFRNPDGTIGLPQNTNMDFYSQASLKTPLIYNYNPPTQSER